MKFKLTFSILTIAIVQTFGQLDNTSIYKGLKTKKFYSVKILAHTSNGKTSYEANGKKVSKSTYSKYESTWKNMETCCPCILKSYDENNVLLREAVSCTDCRVGVYKEFYPNGKVKLNGRYKENPTGNWDNLFERGYCSVKDGKWSYFNDKEDTLYSEYWNNGEFIKQVPEQKTNEIWKVELTLNGESIEEKKELTPDQVRQLVVAPKFKNNSKSNNNFKINFEVSAVGHKQNEKTFTLDNFKNIDVLQMLSEVGIPSNKETNFTLMLLDNEEVISTFYLNIKH